MIIAPYTTGTATVTAGSTAVTGQGTGWAIALAAGGTFSCRGFSVPIVDVEDDTNLVLAYPWPAGAGGARLPYAIDLARAEAATIAGVSAQIAALLGQLQRFDQVDNTRDLDKPVSAPVADALAVKLAHSGVIAAAGTGERADVPVNGLAAICATEIDLRTTVAASPAYCQAQGYIDNASVDPVGLQTRLRLIDIDTDATIASSLVWTPVRGGSAAASFAVGFVAHIPDGRRVRLLLEGGKNAAVGPLAAKLCRVDALIFAR